MNIELIKSVYQYPLLSNKDFELIAEAHEEVKFLKGDFLLKKEQVANEYYILENGLIRSFIYNFEGDDITTSFFSNGDIVIEASSLFQRVATMENIQTLTDCTCWKIDFETFQELFHTIEGFREWGRSWFSHSLFQLKQRITSTIVDSATDRYLNLIKEKPQVIQYAPMKDIASYIGVTDSSLSRIRKEIANK